MPGSSPAGLEDVEEVEDSEAADDDELEDDRPDAGEADGVT